MEQVKSPIIVILFFFASLFLYTKLAGPIPLSINSIQTTKNVFYVQGVGEEKAVPDRATVSLGVNVQGKTAEEAKTKMNEVTNNAVERIKKLGIAEKDIKTINFYVSETPQELIMPDPRLGPNAKAIKPPPLFTGSQTIEVQTNSIELANQVIDAATVEGVNAIGTPSFTINEEDKKELSKKARKKAIADAKKKAQELADEAGIKLGKVIDIQESGGYQPMYYEADKMAMSARLENAPTQLNPGENIVSVNVTLSFETL